MAIATLLAGDAGRVADLAPAAITKDAMRAAFAEFADAHQPESIRRCRSTWNTLCEFLYTAELIGSNPIPLIGRPKVAKTLPKGLGAEIISGLLTAIDADAGSPRRSDWAERDRAIVLTAVIAGLRADELVRADVGDIRTTGDGGVIHVHGKGNKDRRIPVEQALIGVLAAYLDSRATRFPGSARRARSSRGLAVWPATAPLFVGSDGERITRGTLQYRVLRAFKKARLNGERARCAGARRGIAHPIPGPRNRQLLGRSGAVGRAHPGAAFSDRDTCAAGAGGGQQLRWCTGQEVSTLAGGKQTILGGPVASWESIKLMSGDGGGAFNVNSAHPFRRR